MATTTLTSVFPLTCTSEQFGILKDTLDRYTASFNRVCLVGWEMPRLNGVELHKLTYFPEREASGLGSQLTCSARVKATDATASARTKLRKGEKVSCPKAKGLVSIRYDSNSIRIWFDRKEVSLSTVAGRIKIGLDICDYHKARLDWKVCSCDLVLHKNNKLYLHVVFDKEFASVASTQTVGCDLGVNKPVVTSRNEFLGKRDWRRVQERYFKTRKSLQAKGTRSAKRRLQKIGARENRFRKDCDHVISKILVTRYGPGTTLVLENLSQIRKSTKHKKGTPTKRRFHNWSFFRLRSFLEYKAPMYGCSVEFVNPRYTSQECSKCHYVARSNRKSQSEFVCKVCGFKHNADLNASKNIEFRFLYQAGTPDLVRAQSIARMSGLSGQAVCFS